eukprot:1650353-Pleurochrysis_carterae.AAC.2
MHVKSIGLLSSLDRLQKCMETKHTRSCLFSMHAAPHLRRSSEAAMQQAQKAETMHRAASYAIPPFWSTAKRAYKLTSKELVAPAPSASFLPMYTCRGPPVSFASPSGCEVLFDEA